MRRLWDIVLAATITAAVTTLVNNAIAGSSALGRTWQPLIEGFFGFADRAAPVVGVLAGLFLILWLGGRLALLCKNEPTAALEFDQRLPNPLTVLAYTAVLLLAGALSLWWAARGSEVAAVLACCVVAVALRRALCLIADVRRTFFGMPF